jgi:hypothetical protein
MYKWVLSIFLLVLSIVGRTQDGMKFQEKYQVKISKSKSPIKIDGILDEEGWLNAEEAKETSAGTQSNEAATSSTDDTDAATENAINLDGSFSITKEKMATFPDPALKPSEKLKVLQGQEYFKARTAANNANAKIHRSDPSSKGKEIHEKDPVKFGGSPTNPANKVQLTPKAHKEITTWFNQLLREINQLQPKK